MTDLKELIEQEIDQYLEWPTADKSHVTTTSARLFAEHVARLYADHVADTGKKVAPDVQGEPLRYTNDGALAECPCCGSIDVGGAHDTVSCYSCGLTVTKPRPLQNAIDAWNTRTGRTHPAPTAVPSRDVIRATLMAHGFTVKIGQSDLKPYVYEAVEALFARPAPAAPDVAALVDALERVMYCNEVVFLPESVQQTVSDALAAHRKGGDAAPHPIEQQSAPHWSGVNPGLADQYRAEALAARRSLGFDEDAVDVSPANITVAIDSLRQPVPDVSGLVEALEEIRGLPSVRQDEAAFIAGSALATYRKGGEA